MLLSLSRSRQNLQDRWEFTHLGGFVALNVELLGPLLLANLRQALMPTQERIVQQLLDDLRLASLQDTFMYTKMDFALYASQPACLHACQPARHGHVPTEAGKSDLYNRIRSSIDWKKSEVIFFFSDPKTQTTFWHLKSPQIMIIQIWLTKKWEIHFGGRKLKRVFCHQ